MEPTTSDLSKDITRYAKTAAIQGEFFKERLESALAWLEGDIRSIRRSLETNTNVNADNVVAQASRVQDAALKYRLAAENRMQLEDIISVNELAA